jgi:hypothetical protein
MSSQRYALAAQSFREEPQYKWIGSFDGFWAYMETVEESRCIALAFLTPLLCRDE